MKKPNFFIIGMPRSGTTSMYQYLKQHPEIFMASKKEPNFFGKDLHRGNKIQHLSLTEYLNLFKEVKDHKIIGEASVYSYYSESAAEEIYNLCPQTKILLMLRNPDDMIHSLYNLNRFWGNETASFEDAMKQQDNRLRNKEKLGNGNVNIAETLLYKDLVQKIPDSIKKYQTIFGKENVKIIIFDDFKNDTSGNYKDVLVFLGVNPDFQPIFKSYSMSPSPKYKLLNQTIIKAGQLLRPLRKKISKRPLGIIKKIMHWNRKQEPLSTLQPLIPFSKEFYPVIQEIEQLTGKNLSHWCKTQ